MIIRLSRVRCLGCKSVLLVHGVQHGIIEIKCRKSHCRIINIISFLNGIAKIRKKNIDELVDENTYVHL